VDGHHPRRRPLRPARPESRPGLALPVALGWAATDRLSLSAAAGLFHQAPDASDLSAVFGTPSLSLQRATHLSAGQSLRISGDFTLETTAFYRNLEHLVARSRLATPRLAQALTQDGQGRSFGVQWLARLRSRGGLFGWLAHTASRSERRSLGDPTFRLLDDDQSHVLALVAGFERGGWGAGGRLRYTSGAPRTPVIGSFYETTSGQFEPVFGPQNSTRLPPFFQLDLRLERKLSRGAASLTLYLDLLNVTFHKNAEELAYSADYRRRGAISGLPTLAVLGARAER